MILSLEQRENLAQEMATTLARLQQQEPNTLLRELPDDLQKTIRSYKVIGPITSSGIEHVYQLFNRLDFAIDGLHNPEFVVEASGHHYRQSAPTETAHPKVSTNSTENDTIDRLPAAPTPAPLDFGPYDPRKGSPNA